MKDIDNLDGWERKKEWITVEKRLFFPFKVVGGSLYWVVSKAKFMLQATIYNTKKGRVADVTPEDEENNISLN